MDVNFTEMVGVRHFAGKFDFFEFGESRVFATDYALRITSQFDFPESKGKGVKMDEATHQRLPDTE
jgi:hypothetical protein